MRRLKMQRSNTDVDNKKVKKAHGFEIEEVLEENLMSSSEEDLLEEIEEQIREHERGETFRAE